MSEAQRCLTSIIVSWGRIVETGLKTKKLQVVEQNVHGGVTCHRALLQERIDRICCVLFSERVVK